jgi:hypothetical protein
MNSRFMNFIFFKFINMMVNKNKNHNRSRVDNDVQWLETESSILDNVLQLQITRYKALWIGF